MRIRETPIVVPASAVGPAADEPRCLESSAHPGWIRAASDRLWAHLDHLDVVVHARLIRVAPCPGGRIRGSDRWLSSYPSSDSCSCPSCSGRRSRTVGSRGGGAIAAILFLVLLAVVPAPEEGEARLALGDVPFLIVIAVIATALGWLGAMIGRRMAQRRTRH